MLVFALFYKNLPASFSCKVDGSDYVGEKVALFINLIKRFSCKVDGSDYVGQEEVIKNLQVLGFSCKVDGSDYVGNNKNVEVNYWAVFQLQGKWF